MVQTLLEGLTAIRPELFWRRYSKLARRAGFDRLYLTLSCDCDTPEDIPAAARLHDWLGERGLRATFAVPGTLLREGREVYRRLAREGGRFLNHGALNHTQAFQGGYRSVSFYHLMSPEEVERDIIEGHRIFSQVLGEPPTGFRAPHFGLLRGRDLALIHAILARLGYRYSTSTGPAAAFSRGPVWRRKGLVEIPVLGSYVKPLHVLDSWSHLEGPDRFSVGRRYPELLLMTVDRLIRSGVVGVLNYYLDPSHVVDSRPFYDALERINELGVACLGYDDLLALDQRAAL